MQSVLPDLSKLVPTAGRDPPAWPGKGAGGKGKGKDDVLAGKGKGGKGAGGKGEGKGAGGKGAGGKGAGGKGIGPSVQPGKEEVHDFDWALREFDRIDQEKREREARDAAKHSQLLHEERWLDDMQRWGEASQQLPPPPHPPEEVEELVQSKPPPGRETPSQRMARELRELRDQRGRQRQEQEKQEKKEKERQDKHEWLMRKQEYEERRRMAFQPRR